MYISLNRDKMQFLHKHENFRVVCDLDFIEAPRQHVDVAPVDCKTFLRYCTDLELQLLYRNTTGGEDSRYHGDQLRSVITELAERFPVSDVNPFEADQQAASLGKDGHHEPHVYVKGATRAAKPGDLYAPSVLKGTLTEDEAAIAARRRPAPAILPGITKSPPKHTKVDPSAANVVTAPRKAGKTTSTIWGLADRMWEEAGKPKELSTVLHLRKKIMDALEKINIPRSTSSSSLGNWQKARI